VAPSSLSLQSVRVVIAGGGGAGSEAALALRDLGSPATKIAAKYLASYLEQRDRPLADNRS
jgi:flavin-dependent dehydrogenase